MQLEITWPQEEVLLNQELDMGASLRVLDAGCGPGYLTQKLLDNNPSLQITCLDSDPEMIEIAKKNLRGFFFSNFVNEKITETNLSENNFDLVYARYLFMHLPDPGLALREIFRILRPGGKLIILDAYHPLTFGYYPQIEDPIVAKVTNAFRDFQKKQGGNREISILLPKLLKDTGYTDIFQQAVTAHSDITGMEIQALTHNPSLIAPLVDKEVVSQEDFEQFRKVMDEFYADSNSILLFNMFATIGQKPK